MKVFGDSTVQVALNSIIPKTSDHQGEPKAPYYAPWTQYVRFDSQCLACLDKNYYCVLHCLTSIFINVGRANLAEDVYAQVHLSTSRISAEAQPVETFFGCVLSW